MRRSVRYSPLGKTRVVTLVYGLDPQRREAEVIDESTTGLGLRVKEVAGLTLGQQVTVESRRGKSHAAVVRLEVAKEGGFQVGLQYTNQRAH